jgi:hypothetical protein
MFQGEQIKLESLEPKESFITIEEQNKNSSHDQHLRGS